MYNIPALRAYRGRHAATRRPAFAGFSPRFIAIVSAISMFVIRRITCGRRDQTTRRVAALMRRIRTAFDRPAFFQKRFTNLADGIGQECTPFFFRPEQDQINEAFAHFCNQIRQVPWGMLLDILPDDLIDFAMEAAFRQTFILWHDHALR